MKTFAKRKLLVRRAAQWRARSPAPTPRARRNTRLLPAVDLHGVSTTISAWPWPLVKQRQTVFVAALKFQMALLARQVRFENEMSTIRHCIMISVFF
jgi:hypothetical protein